MGLVLRPDEVKSGVAQVRASIESTKESYSGALQTVQSFSQNEALQSESWDAAKNNILEAHQAIAQGMSAAQIIMENDLSTLESSVEGSDDSDEDILIVQIQKLTLECIMYEEMIRRLMAVQSNMALGGAAFVSQLIAIYRTLLKKTRTQLYFLNLMLKALYAKESSTSQLFHDVEPLIQAVECAINDATVYIEGKGTLSDGSWKTTIPATINEMANKNLEDVLVTELGIDIQTFEGLYGEKNVNEIKKYVMKKGVKKLTEEDKKDVLLHMAGNLSGCSVSVIEENEVYEFKNEAGAVKKYTEEKVKNIIKSKRDFMECLDGNGNCSKELVDYIKSKEGLRLTPYNNGETIAFGFDIAQHKDVKINYNPDGSITEQEAERLLEITLQGFEDSVNEYLNSNNLVVDQKTFDTLVDIYYNRGSNELTEEIAMYMSMQNNEKLQEIFLFTEEGKYDEEKFDYRYAYDYIYGKIEDTKIRKEMTEAYLKRNKDGLAARRLEEYLIYEKGFGELGNEET